MDSEIAKALADLDNRISIQEAAHAHVGEGGKMSNGAMHGIISNLPIVVISILVASIVAVAVVNKYKTKNG